MDLEYDRWLPVVTTQEDFWWYVPIKYVVRSEVPKVLQIIVDLEYDTSFPIVITQEDF